jgi:SAM-dependent methyltransferase
MFLLTKQHNWLFYSIINPAIKERLGKYATGEMIDIGCGQKPYKELARPYVDFHTGLDHLESYHDKSNVDLIGTAYAIPAETKSFNTVLCTDVLEHLEEPWIALSEAFRVLKQNGYAIYTVPFFWHLHEEPRDFFRFTKFGLRYLFEKSGFEIVEITPLTGFVATFAQELVYFLYKFRRGRFVNPLWWIIPLLGHFIQLIGYLANKIEKTEIFSCEYIIVAKKN